MAVRTRLEGPKGTAETFNVAEFPAEKGVQMAWLLDAPSKVDLLGINLLDGEKTPVQVEVRYFTLILLDLARRDDPIRRLTGSTHDLGLIINMPAGPKPDLGDLSSIIAYSLRWTHEIIASNEQADALCEGMAMAIVSGALSLPPNSEDEKKAWSDYVDGKWREAIGRA